MYDGGEKTVGSIVPICVTHYVMRVNAHFRIEVSEFRKIILAST